VTRTPTDVSDELFDALGEHFSAAQLVELTAAIALENYRARFNHAFGMGSQGFSEGSYCAVPETLTITKGGE
jgi:alkylhydroperoxidase family enzyme